MNDLNNILPLTTVEDVLVRLREMVRLARQREEWTQADLARRSGVPMNRLDAFEDMLKAQLRLVKFPKTLEGDIEPAPKVVHRVRHKRSSK